MIGYAPRIAGEVLSRLGTSAGRAVIVGLEFNLKIERCFKWSAGRGNSLLLEAGP